VAGGEGMEEQFRLFTLRIEQKIDEQGHKIDEQGQKIDEQGRGLVQQGQNLATIQENQVLLQDSVGAVKDVVSTVKSTFDGWRETCDMSKATKTKHDKNFSFTVVDDDPPMVGANDARISDLVQHLVRCRGVGGFTQSVESACRENAVDGFFQKVATALGSQVVNSASRLLTVRVAQTEFSGYTDILIGQETTLPLLAVEVKPMTGEHRLKGNGFNSEMFSHQTQIVLQCTALQAQCLASRGSYSCVLTNLSSLYIVQVTSYDANTIYSRAFRVVKDATEFVRAVLRAADDNGGIVAGKRDTGLICEAAQGFDSNRPDPEHGGIPQVPRSSASADPVLHGGGGARGGGDLCGTRVAAEQAAWRFERLLPTTSQQKSDVRPNFTRAWVRLSSRECLHDMSNSAVVVHE